RGSSRRTSGVLVAAKERQRLVRRLLAHLAVGLLVTGVINGACIAEFHSRRLSDGSWLLQAVRGDQDSGRVAVVQHAGGPGWDVLRVRPLWTRGPDDPLPARARARFPFDASVNIPSWAQQMANQLAAAHVERLRVGMPL